MSGRLEEGIRENLLHDEKLAEQFFGGPAPVIDRARATLFDWFWAIRRGTPQDQGIAWTIGDLRTIDPIVLHHLRCMDDEYLEDRRRQYADRQAADEMNRRIAAGKT